MEDRIKKLETIVARLSRRAKVSTKAILTPYPISNCVVGDEVKGDVLKYMFTGSGTITKGRIWINPKLPAGASIITSIENDLGSNSKSYNMQRRDLLVQPNMAVQAGDRLTISILPVVPEELITECWVAFEWVPDMPDSVIKRYLLEDLEDDQD